MCSSSSPQAVVNEDTTGDVTQLQAEIRRLKETLSKIRGEWNVCVCVCVCGTGMMLVRSTLPVLVLLMPECTCTPVCVLVT